MVPGVGFGKTSTGIVRIVITYIHTIVVKFGVTLRDKIGKISQQQQRLVLLHDERLLFVCGCWIMNGSCMDF